jgi:hypothetical protein
MSGNGQGPVLALGVDGVIVLDEPVATDAVEHSVDAWGRWRREIFIPADAPEALARLAEHFEIVWVSAWGHNAHTALAPVLGLPMEPWLFLPVQFDKAAAVAEYAGDRDWFLVEDAVGGISDLSLADHVIQVDPTRGLDDVDVDELIARAHRAPVL